MKNLLKFFLAIFFIVVINGCNEDSYIEGQGFVSSVAENPANNQKSGTVTFYSKGDVFFCSGGYTIYIDGNYAGNITEASYNIPKCGSNNSFAVSKFLKVGNHTFSATGSGNYCPRYTDKTFLIEDNTCLSVILK